MNLPIHVTRPDRNRPEPLWHQTELALRALTDGTWPDGAQLPNEAKLGEMFGVSRITMRHALRNLEDWGLLRHEQGRGTFMRSSSVIAGVRGLTRLTRLTAGDGGQGPCRGVTDPRARGAACRQRQRFALEIPEGATVCMIRRLRSGGGHPIGIQTAHLTEKRVPGFSRLAAHALALPHTARPLWSNAAVCAPNFTSGRGLELDAELLEAAPGTPAFIVWRIASDTHGPYEFTVSTMRRDRTRSGPSCTSDKLAKGPAR